MPLALFALAISAFGIGTTEFIINGLLPELAADFSVTIPAAGLLVSGYALGVAVGGPPLTMLGSRLTRKNMLLALMGLFIVGNLLSALAPSYGVLMVGRFLAAFSHGAYFGVGSVVAAEVVAPHKRGSAIALMFTGLTLANVFGVPLGTWIGQAFGWRATFWLVVVIGVIALAGVLALVPQLPRPDTGGVLRELATFRKGSVWLALAMTVFGFAPVFAIITFISPIMTGVAGFSAGAVPVIMVLFGVGMVVGNLIGGRFADRAVMPSIFGSVAGLTVIALVIALVSRNQVAFAVMITLFGVAAMATASPLQTRVLDAASGAPVLASAANIGAFNLGNALGSFLAGLTIEAGLGYTAPAWTAALLGVVGLGVAGVAGLQSRRHALATA